jgi:branched-chain amino acid transport system ATP-binding protein
MLEVRDLCVHYGRICAVEDLSLDVEQGQIVGLIGPNGAGKSSALGAIVGTVPASAGAVRFEGQSLLGQAPERVVRRGVSLVPEGRDIFASMTVAENLKLGTTPLGDRNAAAAALERELGRFPMLRKYYGRTAGHLSGGEQQQLAIARGLLSNPRLLILDEPTLGLAPVIVDLVFEVLAKLRDDGVTVLLVEQNATRTIALADRCYVLRAGRVTLSGEREELPDADSIAHIYLGL